MIEIKARATCCTPDCAQTEEYWATVNVQMVREYDSFKSTETPVLDISHPVGWAQDRNSLYGSGTSVYCPNCVEEMSPERRKWMCL